MTTQTPKDTLVLFQSGRSSHTIAMIPLVRPVTEPELQNWGFGNEPLLESQSQSDLEHTQAQRDEHQKEEDGEQLRHPLELADGRRVWYECEARAALHHLVHLHVQLVSKVAWKINVSI